MFDHELFLTLTYRIQQRRRSIGTRKNSVHNDKSKSLLAKDITLSLDVRASPPHVLVELSTTELERLKENIIHLEGLTVCKQTNTIVWSKFHYGKNVVFKNKSPFSHASIYCNELCLNKMKHRRFIMTAQKSECLTYLPSLITSSSTCNTAPSGVVVLMACTVKAIPKSNRNWNLEDYSRLKKCKPTNR